MLSNLRVGNPTESCTDIESKDQPGGVSLVFRARWSHVKAVEVGEERMRGQDASFMNYEFSEISHVFQPSRFFSRHLTGMRPLSRSSFLAPVHVKCDFSENKTLNVHHEAHHTPESPAALGWSNQSW